jgi:chromosome segregation ATPase
VDSERLRVAELITQKDDLERKAKAAQSEFESELHGIKRELEARADAAEKAVTTLTKENEQLKADLASEKDSNANEWEAKRADLMTELETQRLAMTKESEQLKADLASEKDSNASAWEAKRAELMTELETQKLAMIKSQEEEITRLKQEHKDDLNEQTRAFVGLQENLNKKLTIDNSNLLEEIAHMKKAWDEDRMRLEKMVDDLRGVAQGMETEKGRLEKIVEQFSDETDVKSKGDVK